MSHTVNSTTARRYWQLDYPDGGPTNDVDEYSEAEWTERLYDLLADATRLRLRSDVPVGAYLSGGLDSSVTTALVKQISDNRLCTFSVTFADKEFDESPYQQELVRHLGTDHQTVRCAGNPVRRLRTPVRSLGD